MDSYGTKSPTRSGRILGRREFVFGGPEGALSPSASIREGLGICSQWMVPGRSLDDNGAHSIRAGQSISTFAELYREKILPAPMILNIPRNRTLRSVRSGDMGLPST